MSKKHDLPKHDLSKEDQPEELLTQASPEELMLQLNEAEKKANQYWDRLVRMQADTENANRRLERDLANAHKFALEKFSTELLPIVDSLELCISNETQHDSSNSMIEGVKLTLKMFYTAMEKFGIKQVNPLNQPFDPEFEQAISMQEDPSVEPNTVIAVLQKGYTLNNRLLRPALVVVSKAKS